MSFKISVILGKRVFEFIQCKIETIPSRYIESAVNCWTYIMKKVQGNDSFQRINYLYQISKLISEKNPALSSYYGNLIVNVAKKNVLKIHPDIKRQMCRKCRCMLIDNVTAKMKIKCRKKSKIIEWTCNTCGYKRSFPADRDKCHRLWLEKEEAIVEIIN